MRSRAWGHLRANAVAYLALFVALGGGAYAAGKINGRTIRKNWEPGNRLKKNSATGTQVSESTLGTVPKATTATKANSAATATSAETAKSADNAKNADAVGGVGKVDLGQGIVNGGIDTPANLASFRSPFGVSSPGTAAALEAIAPVAETLRDFEAQWVTNYDGDDTLSISVQINSGSSLTSVPLCTIIGNATQFDCRAAGPVAIPQGALYRLELAGSGLEGNEQATFAYRLAAG